ncbi:MAG: DUF2312 domain-containing protein [Hyphomonadaceae bacterium]
MPKTAARAASARPRARAEAFASDMPEQAAPQSLTQSAREKLRQMVARIEKLEEEKKGVAGDIKEAYAEAKGLGYDTKALRKVISLRRMDANERAEQESMIDLYRHALGDV